MTNIRLITFGGVSTLPVYAALDLGAYVAEGLQVQHELTPNSKVQMRGLIDGEYDIAGTAVDNVIAYLDQEDADLFAFLGGDRNDLPVYVRPEITRESLRGQVWAVDALTTGYAFVLQKILQANGLSRDDYRLESFGATGARWEAVQAGKAVGAVFNCPFDLRAQQAGLRRLAGVYDVLEHYQGSVLATARRWAAGNGEALQAFIRATLVGQEWVRDPANRQGLEALIRERMKLADEPAAAVAESISAGPYAYPGGWGLDPEGVANVLALRREIVGLKRSELAVGQFVDRSYYDAATGA